MMAKKNEEIEDVRKTQGCIIVAGGGAVVAFLAWLAYNYLV